LEIKSPFKEVKVNPDRPDVLIVSHSRIKLWRSCRYAHHLRYNERLEKKRPAIQLVRGKIIHACLEARINGKDWRPIIDEYEKEYNRLFPEEKEIYGDLPNDLRRLMEGYEEEWADEELTYLEKDGKRAEFEFYVPLTFAPEDIDQKTGEALILFHGVIDTVARDKDKRVWVVEHKSHKKIPSESVRFTDIQTTLYYWVAPQIGFPQPDGILWDYIRTKSPAIPELLSSGRLSKRKNIDTTWQVYYQTILEHGLDPNDYQDILEELKSRESFYKRVYFPPPKSIVKPLVSDLYETAKEIQALGKVSKARNITFNCERCSYYPICQAELRGLDSEFVKKAEYKLRGEEKDESIEASEE